MASPALPDEPDLTPIARLRQRFADRAIGIAVAVAIELILLLILLTLGTGITRPGEPDGPAITAFDVAPDAPAQEESEAPPQPQQAPPQPAEPQTQTQPQEEQPPEPQPTMADVPAPPPAVLVLPRPATIRPPAPAAPATPPAPRRPPARQGPVYGPPAPPAGAGMPGDSQRVGSAPNGEPMYAARWYREPTDNELAGYLSTANGPGYGLIACKVVTGYRVEECVGLSEQPQGSNLLRAVLAASWQFRVRPPRIGGKEQFGEWVRIQITYSSNRPPR